jgi:cytochrome c5
MRSILTSTVTALVIAVGILSWHGADAAGLVKAGKFIYNKHCIECHGEGKKGAPILGDKEAWAERIKNGEQWLTNHAYFGHRKMPNLANCGSCTHQDYANAVAYMVSQVQ